MNIPSNLKYTKDHEWILVEGEIGTIGITDYAQSELGDIVYVDIPTLNETLEKDEVFGTIEAVKTVSDMFLPVAGEIIECNAQLESTPENINKDPYGKGWIVKIKITNPSELEQLLDAEAYTALVAG